MATIASEVAALKSTTVSPGTLTDLYEVGDVLGKGGFATVRAGKVRKTGAKVALKILNPKAYSSNPTQARVIFHEIYTLQRVNTIPNANLMKFHAAHEDMSSTTGLPRLTIVTQMCSGGELFDRIVKAGHYSEKEAAELVSKLAKALSDLHARHIIHRDLKPENVLYADPSPNAEPIIADYGLARLTDKSDVHASLVGTPGYLAPEIISQRKYSPAVDVWALGVITYILLCGYPPFYAEDNKTLYAQICAGSYEFHDDAWHAISDPAKDLVRRMLVTDPSHRITIAGILEHPWITTHAPHTTTKLTKAIANLKLFNAKRKIKAAAMAAAFGFKAAMLAPKPVQETMGSKTFTVDEVAELTAAFTKVAKPGTTTVNLEQFTAAITAVGHGNTIPVTRMFELFDTDGSGDLDYREFLIGIARMRTDGDEALRMAFDIFDADKSGFLSPTELMQMLSLTGLDLGTASAEAAPGAGDISPATAAAHEGFDPRNNMTVDDATATYLAKIFTEMDTNHDGKVTWVEFKRAVQSDPKIKQAVMEPFKRFSSTKK